MKRFAFAIALILPSAGAGFAQSPDLPVQTLAQAGHPRGGTSFTRSCPSGSVLTGIRIRKRLIIDAIAIKCRTVGADGTLGAESTAGVFVGGEGGTGSSASCPNGSVITGSTAALASPVGLYGFAFECRHWNAATRSWSGPALMAIGIPTTPTLLLMVLPGPDLSALAGFSTYRACANKTQPAQGIGGRSGTNVDAVGLRCDEP